MSNVNSNSLSEIMKRVFHYGPVDPGDFSVGSAQNGSGTINQGSFITGAELDALAQFLDDSKKSEWLADDMGYVPPPVKHAYAPTAPPPPKAYAGPPCSYCGDKDHGAHFSCGCPNRGKLCNCEAIW